MTIEEFMAFVSDNFTGNLGTFTDLPTLGTEATSVMRNNATITPPPSSNIPTGKATTTMRAGLAQRKTNGTDSSTDSGNWLSKANANIKSLNGSPIGGIASNLAGGLRGLTEQDVEYTGKTAETLNNISGTLEGINAQINPLGNAVSQAGAAIGNFIGGTEDRVKGAGSAAIDTISAVASNFGPIGMAAATALQFINGIGGKRVNKLTDMTGDITKYTGSAYSGSVGDVSESIDKYSNKKAGLFDFGFARKGNKAISAAKYQQNLMLDVSRDANTRKIAAGTMSADLAQRDFNRRSGNTGMIQLSKLGSKLPELSWSRNLLFKYKEGGKTQKIKPKRRTLEELKAYADSVNPRFVQRMNNPNITGINFIDDEGNSAFGTHYMEVGDDGKGHFYVYPRIQEINGQLQFFKNWEEALDTALKNKNYLLFDNLEEADNFASNYKKVYPVFQKFQKGGKLGTPGIESNVIVEGAYHAHKNHLDEVNPELSDMTPKGIPVATEDASGNKTQVAEIEVGELILTKDLTDKLEELYKDGSDEAAIQAGMLFANEIIDNTVDNKGGVLDEDN